MTRRDTRRHYHSHRVAKGAFTWGNVGRPGETLRYRAHVPA